MKRCEWANKGELEQSYHDNEWGVAIHDDRSLFEFLVLEGAQAGLSWSIILRKREGYRKAFDNFDVHKISRYSENDVARLIISSEIIRNKLKINATITNARAFLQVQKQFGSFDHYIWQFVNGRPIQNSWAKMSDIPSISPESEAMSKDLQKRGFKFVGPGSPENPALMTSTCGVELDIVCIDWDQIIEFQFNCLKIGLNGICIPDLIIVQNVK